MSKTRRKTGAQPGNHNALKHGFYSKFKTVGRVDHVPARAAAQELDHDIALTRATLKDLFLNDPHNARLITYTMSLHDRLLRTRQTLIDCDRRAKRRQRRSRRDSSSTIGPMKTINAGLPTSSAPKPKAPYVQDPARRSQSGTEANRGSRLRMSKIPYRRSGTKESEEELIEDSVIGWLWRPAKRVEPKSPKLASTRLLDFGTF